MSKTMPGFVRLNSRLSRSAFADVGGSGFKITGRDVKPTDELSSVQQKAVKRLLNKGTLEEASQEEYDLAHPDVVDETPVVRMITDATPHQEAKVRRAAARKGRELTEARRSQARALAGDEYDEADEDEPQGDRLGTKGSDSFAKAGVPSEGLPSKRSSGDDEDDSPYEGKSKAELQSLIDERNEGRDEDDKLSRNGKVAELARRLEVDDELSSDDDEE